MSGNPHVLRLLSAARDAARDTEETVETRLQQLLIAVDMVVVHLQLDARTSCSCNDGQTVEQPNQGPQAVPKIDMHLDHTSNGLLRLSLVAGDGVLGYVDLSQQQAREWGDALHREARLWPVGGLAGSVCFSQDRYRKG